MDRLGAGGMGTVFLGQAESGRLVAIKVVHQQLADDYEFQIRFRQEVAAARRVSGAYTAPVVDADPDAEQPWMATLYVPGRTLRAQVEELGPLSGAELRRLAVGLVEALRDMHQVGVIHRDLKPDNVLLTEDGPRVIDFGISRATDHHTLTVTGRILGTPPYMSPEQLSAPHRVQASSDVFSLGAVLAYATCGRGPFDAENHYLTAYQVVHEPPDIAQLSGSIREIVQWCLAKDPDERPRPADLLEAFRRAPESEWGARPARHADRRVGARTPAAAPGAVRRRRWRIAALVATGAVLVAAGTYLGLREGSDPDASRPTAGGTSSPDTARQGPTAQQMRGGPQYQAVYGGSSTGFSAYADAPGRRPPGWQAWTSAAQAGPCVYADGSLLCVATDGDETPQVTRLGAADGKAVWSRPAPVKGDEAPVVLDDLVIASSEGGLRAFRLSDGSPQWSLPLGATVRRLTADGERVYGTTSNGTLIAVDPAEGKEAWRRRIPTAMSNPVVRVADSVVHVLGSSKPPPAAARADQLTLLRAAGGEVVRQVRLERPCDHWSLAVATSPDRGYSYLCQPDTQLTESPGLLEARVHVPGPEGPAFSRQFPDQGLVLSYTRSNGQLYVVRSESPHGIVLAELDTEGVTQWHAPLGVACDAGAPAPVVVTGELAYLACGPKGVVVDLNARKVVQRFTVDGGSELGTTAYPDFLVAGGIVFARHGTGWTSVDPFA